MAKTYIFGSWLNIRVVDLLSLLGDHAAKPAKPLRQRRHRILREVVRRGYATRRSF